MRDTEQEKTWMRIVLGVLQTFSGITGIAGGFLLIINPSGAALRLSPLWLEGTPFSTYLVPGVVLFLLIGVAQLIGGAYSFFHHARAADAGALLGVLLCLWIVFQVLWIGLKSFLQPLYFVIGIIEMILGTALQKKAGQEPR